MMTIMKVAVVVVVVVMMMMMMTKTATVKRSLWRNLEKVTVDWLANNFQPTRKPEC
jgi:hypothetical protein